ncbi:MAG: aspartate/glutamate racemase family protein [Acidobacteria bacterium]|nr:aspartate/glutamate racemase family protein [Acidobacteriota bacterium]
MHLVITDSGLGGLSICAGIERTLREAPSRPAVRITYVNAWPEEGRGYNDLSDMASRARAFDRALAAMDALRPDLILIACNTLSIVYELTVHRARAAVPVEGIVDAGVDLFAAALTGSPDAALVLLGTKTTVASGVHRSRLVERGIAAARVGAASCHGLATAIERGPASDATAALIAACARGAAAAGPPGEPLYAALCCTHYGLVADRLVAGLREAVDRRVEALDPNRSLVEAVTQRILGGAHAGQGTLQLEMLSKVEVPREMRKDFATVIAPLSAPTASALEACTHVPDLF